MTLKESFLEFLHHGKIYSKKQIISAAIFPAALIYFEVLFRIISVKEWPGFWWWLAMICASIVGGLLLTMLCTITKNEKINNIIGLIVLQAASIIFMIFHFVGFEFNIYIGPQGIFGGAGGVAGEASDHPWKLDHDPHFRDPDPSLYPFPDPEKNQFSAISGNRLCSDPDDRNYNRSDRCSPNLQSESFLENCNTRIYV